MGPQTIIWVIWSGKFPRTSCFGVFDKNGVDGCAWIKNCLHGSVWTHRQEQKQKQGEKSPKWMRRGRFVKHAHIEKKQEGANDGYNVRTGAFAGI